MLTKVHVLGLSSRFSDNEKIVLARVQTHALQQLVFSGKSKYYGNWCGNPLAVTIYVNTKTLLFSQAKSSASCKRR